MEPISVGEGSTISQREQGTVARTAVAGLRPSRRHILPVGASVSYFTCLCLGFLDCKMGTIYVWQT